MRWDEVAKQALIELGRHGPDGLFLALMFGLLLLAAHAQVSGWASQGNRVNIPQRKGRGFPASPAPPNRS